MNDTQDRCPNPHCGCIRGTFRIEYADEAFDVIVCYRCGVVSTVGKREEQSQ